MKKGCTTLIVLMYILLTITPSLVQSESNQDYSLCWRCSDVAPSSTATYKENLKALLSFSNLTLQSGAVGYYNKSEGKEADDQVTVIGLCRGDLERSPELCKTCLKNIGATVLESCPIQKDAIIWGVECTLWYSNDSTIHLMEEGHEKVLVNNNKYSGYVETFNVGLKFLLGKLIQNASSSVPRYASGSINITESNDIFSLVQCMPSLSQKQCSDCLNESSSEIRSCCAGVIGARVLKPSCTLRYENNEFYTSTRQTFDQQFLTTVNPSQPSQSPPQPSKPPPPEPSKPPPQDSLGGKSHGIVVVVVVVSLVAGIFLTSCVGGALCKRRKKKRKLIFGATNSRSKKIKHEQRGESIDLPIFDFDTIIVATNYFSSDNKLGEGGFGPVYKGKLGDDQEIAVKRLSKTSSQGSEEFKNEVMLIAKLQHRNLVRLLGCCIQEEERMLIYEYLPNNSLDAFFFEKEKRLLLDWNTRYQIITGIARGLLYLHQDSRFRIIHRDLKPGNILLDKEMIPKISDFGMARIFSGNETDFNTRKIVGTYGYMSPEYALYGAFSVKSDVFSFGVLVLEIICGKKNRVYAEPPHINLLAHAWSLWNEGNGMQFVDDSMSNSFLSDEILRCINLGLLCVQEHPEDRPLMSTVVQMFGSDVKTIPQPKQPGFAARVYLPEVDPSSNHCSNELSITTLLPR